MCLSSYDLHRKQDKHSLQAHWREMLTQYSMMHFHDIQRAVAFYAGLIKWLGGSNIWVGLILFVFIDTDTHFIYFTEYIELDND